VILDHKGDIIIAAALPSQTHKFKLQAHKPVINRGRCDVFFVVCASITMTTNIHNSRFCLSSTITVRPPPPVAARLLQRGDGLRADDADGTPVIIMHITITY
jgi:hypothetical protein